MYVKAYIYLGKACNVIPIEFRCVETKSYSNNIGSKFPDGITFKLYLWQV